MIIPKYITSKAYQAVILFSGMLLGVNNYKIISALKDRIEYTISPRIKNEEITKYLVLEELIEFRGTKDEQNNLRRINCK